MLVKREKSKNKTSKVSSMRRRQNMCYLGIKRRHYHNNSSPVTCMRFLGRWEIEWCLCKDSSVFEAYRHSGQKCNLIATCIPLDRIRVPLDRTSIPLDRTSIPLDRTFLPLDRTSIPLDGTFLPLDRTFIPFDRTFLPFHRTIIPFDRPSIILPLAIHVTLVYFSVAFHICPYLRGWQLLFGRSRHLVSGEASKAKPRSLVRAETYDLWLYDVQLKTESHVEPRFPIV